MLKLVYYVPESHLERTKAAIFAAGAGGIGNYSQCAWQVKGQGQFQANDGANPFLGQIGQLECVDEWRVETIVPEQSAQAVHRALMQSHPYEEPAFEFYQLVDVFA
ncbi:MAG: NGG1p interacting factor NIF3 [Acinetobacter sp.]|nr:NGG1p interacting factor NIF3 [Acinetobacter sp.]